MEAGEQSAPGELHGCAAIREFRRRKQVEQDASVLRNRLLQLERQADKAKKRIAQTRQRAKEVVAQRERNTQREQEKHRLIEELEQSIEKHRQAIAKCASICAHLRLILFSVHSAVPDYHLMPHDHHEHELDHIVIQD